jgi:hypothetical protein
MREKNFSLPLTFLCFTLLRRLSKKALTYIQGQMISFYWMRDEKDEGYLGGSLD